MTTRWDTPTTPVRLPADELHVWRVSLAGDSDLAAALSETLSPDERLRADRFRLPRGRRRFIVARGTLRRLLGQTLACDPAALTFIYGPQGKPALPAVPDLAFNLSHSGDLALIALRWGNPVGVDIEQIRPDLEWQGIAHRFFGDGELAWLHSLPVADQIPGFFRLWTRKEAYIKACGEGVWHDLRRFDVTQSLVIEDGDALADTNWHLHDFNVGEDCQSAICVQGALPRMRLWSIPRIEIRGWKERVWNSACAD